MPQTRRTFLRNASLLAASTTVAPFAIGRSLSRDPIGVGIIGTGDRGTGLMRLIEDIEGLEVRAVCDVIDFRLAAAAKTAGERAKSYVNYRALLDDANVEAVLLATPYGMHGPHALDALDAGKHLYCEKTMARGADVSRVLAKAEANSKQIFQTGHQWHSSALFREVKAYVDKGWLGEVTGIHCQWNRNASWRRPVPADRPELERQINWRMYREYSGGMVAELMSHQIDFANWITGEHPSKISGQGGIDHYKDGRETFDNVHLQMQYPGGLDATYTCTTINKHGGFEVRVLGQKATAILDFEKGWLYHEDTRPAELGMVDGVTGATVTRWAVGEGVQIDADGSDPTSQALVHFQEAIVSGRQPESNVHTGAVTAHCVDLGIRAAMAATTLEWDA